MSTTKDNHIVENEEFIRTKIELLQAKLGSARVLIARCMLLMTFSREEDANAIIERHIKLLHDYNASKDAAQVGFA